MSSVAVVGAGPVGLTAALLLARRGVAVTVLDRQRAPYPLPRAVHLDAECFRVLQDAGVADAVRDVSRPMAGLRLLDRRLRPLAEFTRDPTVEPHGWPPDVLLHQPDLDRVLRAAAVGTPGVSVEDGAEVVDLRQDGGGVSLTVRHRAGGADRSVRTDAALGCDGAGSTVRRLTGGSMRDLGRPDRWLVADLLAPDADLWPGTHQVCDPRRPVTFMPVPGGRVRFEWRLAPGEDGAAAAPALLERHGLGAAPVERVAEYTFRAQVADRWRCGRVLLAGDAAHLTPPFVGQGLGLGLRDVHQLAWKLADVLCGRAGDTLLDTHQAEREPHARALIRVAQLVGELMTGGGAAGAAVRRAVLAVLPRLPGIADFAVAGRTPPLRRGPLVERRGRAGRRLAGALVPQPMVRLDDADRRLDDVLGTGWAVLSLLGDDRIAVRADGRCTELSSPELAGWLRTGRATSVVVRPDRIVRSAR
ncbi:bifunctional 3-(3-hydroxy-phenyl)propionate/3-hydroxycinnamic acid hydroxylase [Geodermatophilus sp. YIM 151500]|uniref:bifunctional 3-(3-hydroxy-phenyl)propionate/3-hydroxycinnamic acid hydroxylase n=1 Tax=Geodermatophilus sp. YIM 151500 TaxID=2984531 RepID=UPI0021E47613|nr:bifunctional 3-(3-hydroxy-phenyl)propionate/3-hydroxycinnamic acid hydroxylase [Geodermatophilus sp. YIM 151500]MCV2490106.1 bifunctional 3-(3-hydroxy-phenyl)propionate/3-hydroxycinnamic acid hydroxylase [Geodermatophilus sp. YIM 151500]